MRASRALTVTNETFVTVEISKSSICSSWSCQRMAVLGDVEVEPTKGYLLNQQSLE